jgi:hypothetical protein
MNIIFKEFTTREDTKVSINIQRILCFNSANSGNGTTLINLGGDDYLFVKETYEQVKEILSSNQ